MSKTQIMDRLEEYREKIEQHLFVCIKDDDIPETLKKAMRYSLLAGGKRIRPILCVSWAEHFGLEVNEVIDFASSLELIHTYSLIHDDLPAMDNDELRRGRPTNHVQFGEAMAILAGDGLLTEAFSLMLRSSLPAKQVIQAVQELAQAAGPRGMVGGQAIDIGLTGQSDVSLSNLKKMHSYKTGALIRASCLSGAVLAEARNSDLQKVSRFGKAIGLAFQVADDILDLTGDKNKMGKPIGSDIKQNKITYPSILGLEKSKKFGLDLVEEATSAIKDYSGPQIDFLTDLAHYIINRVE